MRLELTARLLTLALVVNGCGASYKPTLSRFDPVGPNSRKATAGGLTVYVEEYASLTKSTNLFNWVEEVLADTVNGAPGAGATGFEICTAGTEEGGAIVAQAEIKGNMHANDIVRITWLELNLLKVLATEEEDFLQT